MNEALTQAATQLLSWWDSAGDDPIAGLEGFAAELDSRLSVLRAAVSVPAGAAPETERLRVALKAYAAAFRAVPPVLAAEMKPTERHVAGMRAALGSEPPERGGG